MGGDEVGAAGVGELDVEGDGVVADGAEDGCGEGEVAAQAGVAAEEEMAEAAELGVLPLAPGGRWGPGLSRRGRLGRGGLGCRPRMPSRRMVPASAGLGSVRTGWASRRRRHWWGSGSQRAKSASVREKGVLTGMPLGVELEVEAGAGGLDVGEAGAGPR